MKPFVLAAFLWTSVPGVAAAFVNFTFDDGPIDPSALVDHGVGAPYSGGVGNIIPGWDIVYRGSAINTVGYSTMSHRGDLQPVTLREYRPGEPFGQVGGRNALSLIVGDPPPTLTLDLLIRQRGEIPVDAVSFEIRGGGRGVVRIDGVTIHEFDSELNYNPIVNVSPYAGREVTLEFAFYRGGSFYFDNLGFTSVPEPSTWALLGVGTLGLGWGAMRGRRGSGNGAQ